LAIIIIGASWSYVISNRTNLFNSPESVPAQVEQTTGKVQTITDGAVTYTVTPKDLTTLATTWDFEISMDTHTGSLDQDLVALISLVDNNGIESRATKWEGDPPGGHHREGTLKFSTVTPRPAFIELNIQTTGGTKETSLRWNI